MLTSATTTTRRLLTIEEVAERLRLHKASVYRKVHSGELPAVKLTSRGRGALRIPEDELNAWLTETPEGTAT